MIQGLQFLLQRVAFLTEPIPGLVGPEGMPDVVAPADGGATTVVTALNGAPPPEPGLFGGWGFMLIWAGIIVVMYLLMFRPQRKREKKMKEMQASIKSGDNVIISGGLFGKVADVGEDCFIVEFGTNRGIRIPVLKTDVLGVRAPKMTPAPKEISTSKKED
jgi:preprotein translocase subunit YajC